MSETAKSIIGKHEKLLRTAAAVGGVLGTAALAVALSSCTGGSRPGVANPGASITSPGFYGHNPYSANAQAKVTAGIKSLIAYVEPLPLFTQAMSPNITNGYCVTDMSVPVPDENNPDVVDEISIGLSTRPDTSGDCPTPTSANTVRVDAEVVLADGSKAGVTMLNNYNYYEVPAGAIIYGWKGSFGAGHYVPEGEVTTATQAAQSLAEIAAYGTKLPPATVTQLEVLAGS